MLPSQQSTQKGKLLITRFPLEAAWGGEEEIHLLLVQVLRENGMDAEILTSDHELKSAFREKGFAVFPEFATDITSRRQLFWSIITVPLFFLRGLFWLPYFRLRGSRNVLFLTLMEKVCWTPLAWLCGLRVFWAHHAPLGDWFFRNPYLFFWKLWAKGKLQIIVPAEALHQELLPLVSDPKKIRVLPNTLSANKICVQGYDTTVARQKLSDLVQQKCVTRELPRDAFLIGTANRLAPEKGMEDVLEAMKMLKSAENSYTLLCAGSGPERANLEAKVVREGLTGSVFFLGFLTPAELCKLYQGIDLFLLASHREPFGIALLEAMSAAKAIIASAVGGIPEVLGTDHQGLFPPHDPAQIAAHIHFFRTMETERQENGLKNLQRFQAHFSPPNFRTAVLNIFCTQN